MRKREKTQGKIGKNYNNEQNSIPNLPIINYSCTLTLNKFLFSLQHIPFNVLSINISIEKWIGRGIGVKGQVNSGEKENCLLTSSFSPCITLIADLSTCSYFSPTMLWAATIGPSSKLNFSILRRENLFK